MAVIFGKAPGKIILFGEHAVVYGYPAIAIPVTKVNATARIFPNVKTPKGHIRIVAPDIDLESDLDKLNNEHPIAKAVHLTLAAVAPSHTPAFTLHVSSTIPTAAGLGSGAAISVAIIRALSDFLGQPQPPEIISNLAYEIEKIYHGNPSGIDNQVVTYQKPVYFIRHKPIEFLNIENPTSWVIADSGEKTPTIETVSSVRTLYENDPERVLNIFKKMGSISEEARKALKKANLDLLGTLMNENQAWLETLNVSSPILNNLINAAKTAGAHGAKLSGGGKGGNIIALVSPDKVEIVERALTQAGAAHLIITHLTKGLNA